MNPTTRFDTALERLCIPCRKGRHRACTKGLCACTRHVEGLHGISLWLQQVQDVKDANKRKVEAA